MNPQGVPDLSARELMAVVAVAEYGSFVAASAFLKTSQPAVTRAVKRTEQTLGVMLFARSTRRVEITPAGREFVAVAERLLTDLQLAVRNMRDLSAEQRGQVVISTYSAFACQALPAILAHYRDDRPHIEVRLREGRQPDIVDDVRSGVADFGIGFVNALPDTLQSKMLRREPLCVMIPANHSLARMKPARVSLTALRRHTLIALPGDSYSRRLVDGAAAAKGFALRYSTIVTRFESVAHYVMAGAGLGIIPAGAVPLNIDGFHAAPLASPALTVTLGVITRRASYMTPAAAGLVSLITARVGPLGRG